MGEDRAVANLTTCAPLRGWASQGRAADSAGRLLAPRRNDNASRWSVASVAWLHFHNGKYQWGRSISVGTLFFFFLI